MNSSWKRFASLGLYLALLAALVSAGLFIVQREFNLALQISLALIVVGLALYALLDPERVRQFLTGRQARYGSNALILGIAFVGILVVINYLAYQNARRWDLTEDQQFTLAPETIETLQKLPEPVEARAFYTQRLPTEQAQRLLDQYAFHSDGKFDYAFIDPDANPLEAQQAEITRDGTIVLTMGDQNQQVTAVTEQELTGALVRLISPDTRKVYFLTGHGERDIETPGDTSFSVARRILTSKNYNLESLNLLAAGSIPDDARLIIIAGPTQPLTTEEVDLLSAYVENGGALIVMEEPLPMTEFGEGVDPLAGYLADNWGINLGSDIIVDVNSAQASLVAVSSDYGSHAITQGLTGLVTLMPTARSVTLSEPANGATQTELVFTTQQAWAETDLAMMQSEQAEVSPDEGQDLLGPVPMAAAAENFSNNARLVVFGDADFASDSYFTAYANGDLFVNAVDWAAGEEDLINLTPKESTQRLLLPPQQTTMNLILLGTVFILPGLTLAAGVFTWVQKRRRG